MLHGHPFAHVVPKMRLNIFDFVRTDNLRCQAIVFSDGSDKNAFGWIYAPTSGFARFVPFSTPPSLSLPGGFDFVFDYLFFLLWVFKWEGLLGFYGLILAIRLFKRRKRQSATVGTA
jgi:hypothetical protein